MKSPSLLCFIYSLNVWRRKVQFKKWYIYSIYSLFIEEVVACKFIPVEVWCRLVPCRSYIESTARVYNTVRSRGQSSPSIFSPLTFASSSFTSSPHKLCRGPTARRIHNATGGEEESWPLLLSTRSAAVSRRKQNSKQKNQCLNGKSNMENTYLRRRLLVPSFWTNILFLRPTTVIDSDTENPCSICFADQRISDIYIAGFFIDE